MIHKARALCPNGHVVEFGACNKEKTFLLFFKTTCTSKDHEALSSSEIQCQECHTIHLMRTCPECNADIPVSAFKQKSQAERLSKVFHGR
ncbi:MAG TPA: hypothetical protein VLN91_07990 [Nitrospirota bacterium]|nr:hypothetical protein [Nitrospirota bacterium]